MAQFSNATEVIKRLFPLGNEHPLYLFGSAMEWLAHALERERLWHEGKCACGEPLVEGADMFDRCWHD